MSRLFYSLLFAIVAISMSAGESFAQGSIGTETQKPISLPGIEIVDSRVPQQKVTARKRLDAAKDIPFGLSVKTREELAERGTNRVRETLRDVPSVNVTGFGDGRSTSFLVRGIGPLRDPLGPDDTTFVVFVDGVPQPLFAADVGFLDLEQVELLKGPQSTLFGRNTTAGALTVTTAKPTNDPEFLVRGEVGTDGYFLTEAIASGPIVDDLIAGRLAFRFNGVNGFAENVLTGNDLGEQDVVSGRGTLKFTPSNNTAVTASLFVDRDDRTFPFFILRTEPNFPIASLADDPSSERRYVAGTITVEHRTENFTIRSITGVTRLRTLDLFVDDTEGFTFSQITGFPVAAFASNDSFTLWNEKRQTFSQEILLSSLPNQEIAWVAGLSYYDSTFEADYVNENLLFPGLNGRRLNELKNQTLSGFGELTLPLLDKLKITTGGRISRDDKSYDLRYFGNGFPGTVDRFQDAGELRFNSVTGRASLSYDMTTDSSAYVTVSRGYKSGGFPRFVNDAALGLATEPYTPTRTWTYEAGVKYRPQNSKTYIDIGVFYNDVSDEQLVAFDPSTFSFRPENIDVITYGVEASFKARITDVVNFKGAAGYTVAELVDIDPATAPAGARNGNTPTNVPELTLSAVLEYRQPMNELGLPLPGEVFGNMAWEFVGSRPADVANSFFLDAYHIVNGRAGFRTTSGLEIYAFGKNILNETPQLAGAFVPPNTEAAVPGRSRILGIGTVARW